MLNNIYQKIYKYKECIMREYRYFFVSVIFLAFTGSAFAESGYQVIRGTRVFTVIDHAADVAIFSNECGRQTLTHRQLQAGAWPSDIIPCPRKSRKDEENEQAEAALKRVWALHKKWNMEYAAEQKRSTLAILEMKDQALKARDYLSFVHSGFNAVENMQEYLGTSSDDVEKIRYQYNWASCRGQIEMAIRDRADGDITDDRMKFLEKDCSIYSSEMQWIAKWKNVLLGKQDLKTFRAPDTTKYSKDLKFGCSDISGTSGPSMKNCTSGEAKISKVEPWNHSSRPVVFHSMNGSKVTINPGQGIFRDIFGDLIAYGQNDPNKYETKQRCLTSDFIATVVDLDCEIARQAQDYGKSVPTDDAYSNYMMSENKLGSRNNGELIPTAYLDDFEADDLISGPAATDAIKHKIITAKCPYLNKQDKDTLEAIFKSKDNTYRRVRIKYSGGKPIKLSMAHGTDREPFTEWFSLPSDAKGIADTRFFEDVTDVYRRLYDLCEPSDDEVIQNAQKKFHNTLIANRKEMDFKLKGQ